MDKLLFLYLLAGPIKGYNSISYNEKKIWHVLQNEHKLGRHQQRCGALVAVE